MQFQLVFQRVDFLLNWFGNEVVEYRNTRYGAIDAVQNMMVLLEQTSSHSTSRGHCLTACLLCRDCPPVCVIPVTFSYRSSVLTWSAAIWSLWTWMFQHLVCAFLRFRFPSTSVVLHSCSYLWVVQLETWFASVWQKERGYQQRKPLTMEQFSCTFSTVPFVSESRFINVKVNLQQCKVQTAPDFQCCDAQWLAAKCLHCYRRTVYDKNANCLIKQPEHLKNVEHNLVVQTHA